MHVHDATVLVELAPDERVAKEGRVAPVLSPANNTGTCIQTDSTRGQLSDAKQRLRLAHGRTFRGKQYATGCLHARIRKGKLKNGVNASAPVRRKVEDEDATDRNLGEVVLCMGLVRAAPEPRLTVRIRKPPCVMFAIADNACDVSPTRNAHDHLDTTW